MKFKNYLIAGILIVAFAFVSVPVLDATNLPCYDQWKGCTDSGASSEYCDGLWKGCMHVNYNVVY